MEEDQELRFVCKLCNKKYPSGKSLGGHMRSHVIANSSESDEKTDHIINNSSNKLSRFELGGGGGSGGGGGGNSNSGYVLRENPKKSWRAKDSPIANNINGNQHQQQQQQQQQQDKLMVCRQCGKGFQSLKALCGHMACHSDRERGSKDDDSSWNTENHQKLVTDSHSDTESDALSRRSSQMTRYYNNCSSSSEIDHEQEELALCLMMLSRESGKWVNMNSTHLVDSSISDHNNNNSDSVVSETKSYSNRTRILSDNSDSGYFMNEPETETDQKMESGYEIEKKKTVSLTDHREFQLQTKNSSSKKKKTASLSVNVDGSKNVFKRSKQHYHNHHHHSNNTNNSDDLERPVKSSKKMKGHVCPICNRVFKSGQALGGHKRSHFLVGASQERNHHHHHHHNSRTTVLMKQEESESHDFLDLNLPPPTEE